MGTRLAQGQQRLLRLHEKLEALELGMAGLGGGRVEAAPAPDEAAVGLLG